MSEQCPYLWQCIDSSCQPQNTTSPEESSDSCGENADGQPGDSCNGAADCCNGLCIGDATIGQGECTKTCTSDSDCNSLDLSCVTIDSGSFCVSDTLQSVLGAASASQCEGRANGQFTDLCTGAADCCNGLCIGSTNSAYGTCTIQCTSHTECNPAGGDAYICLSIPEEGRFCSPSDFKQPCYSNSSCSGQLCLQGFGTSGCTMPCNSNADCPSDSTCGPVMVDSGFGIYVEVQACAPVGEACVHDPYSNTNTCLSGTCILDDESNNGYCTGYCNIYDEAPCPNGYVCANAFAGHPPLCVSPQTMAEVNNEATDTEIEEDDTETGFIDGDTGTVDTPDTESTNDTESDTTSSTEEEEENSSADDQPEEEESETETPVEEEESETETPVEEEESETETPEEEEESETETPVEEEESETETPVEEEESETETPEEEEESPYTPATNFPSANTPGSYNYNRLPVPGLKELKAVDFHPSGDFAILAENSNVLRIFDAETEEVVTYDFEPNKGNYYWEDITFSPNGSHAWIVGEHKYTSGGNAIRQGIILKFSSAVWNGEDADNPIVLLESVPNASNVSAVEFDPYQADDPYFLFRTRTGAAYTVALRQYDLTDESFRFIGAQATGAGCQDLARTKGSFGELGWLIVCGVNGYDGLYISEIEGVSQWRTDLGNNHLGNTSRAAAHPSGNYALAISWTGRDIHRFTYPNMTSSSAAVGYSNRDLWNVAFKDDGSRALIFGHVMTIYGDTFAPVIEYRHDHYDCPSPLLDGCELTEVPISNIAAPPFSANSNARLNDAAWRPGCDGGIIAAGHDSQGMLITFQREGGINCW